MPFRKADATRNAKLQALVSLMDGGTIEWRTGAIPATPAVADSGVLLATNTMGATAFTAPVAGVSTYNVDTPNNQVAIGDIGHARIKTSGGIVVADVDVGLVGTVIIVDRIAVTTGEKVNIQSFSITEPM